MEAPSSRVSGWRCKTSSPANPPLWMPHRPKSALSLPPALCRSRSSGQSRTYCWGCAAGCALIGQTEDAPDLSFVGKRETFLNVRGVEVVLDAGGVGLGLLVASRAVSRLIWPYLGWPFWIRGQPLGRCRA